MKWEKHWLTGNVGLSICVLIQYLENLSNHSYNWLHSLILESYLWVQEQYRDPKVYRMWTHEIVSILPSHWDSSPKFHEDANFASSIVHEEIVHLVDVRLLDEHVSSLKRENFIQLFVYFCHNLLGIRRVYESLLDNQRESDYFWRSWTILICSLAEPRNGFSLTFGDQWIKQVAIF